MVDRGRYPNPDYGLNNMAIPESLAHQDYCYHVEFRTPAAAQGRRLRLTFEGVNYAAEVWLNGRKLRGFKGAFVRGVFDVTDLVKASGENALAVLVSPPPHAGIPEEESLTSGAGEDGGVEVLDGPTFAASEGWDWIPGIRDRNTGIWQPVVLSASGPIRIGDLNTITTLPSSNEADIEIDVPLTIGTNAPVEGELTASFDDVKVTKQVRLAPGKNDVRLTPAEFTQLKVQHPHLWWPNGYGDPALHTLHTTFAIGHEVSAARQIEFGMREVSELSLLDSTGHLRSMEVFPSARMMKRWRSSTTRMMAFGRSTTQTQTCPIPAKSSQRTDRAHLGADSRARCAGVALGATCGCRLARHRSGDPRQWRAHRCARRQLGHG